MPGGCAIRVVGEDLSQSVPDRTDSLGSDPLV